MSKENFTLFSFLRSGLRIRQMSLAALFSLFFTSSKLISEESDPKKQTTQSKQAMQSIPTQSIPTQLIQGMEPSQVESLIGIPDKKSGDSKSIIRYHYGESLIVFSRSKLVLLSDKGELSTLLKGVENKQIIADVRSGTLGEVVRNKLSQEELQLERLEVLKEILELEK